MKIYPIVLPKGLLAILNLNLSTKEYVKVKNIFAAHVVVNGYTCSIEDYCYAPHLNRSFPEATLKDYIKINKILATVKEADSRIYEKMMEYLAKSEEIASLREENKEIKIKLVEITKAKDVIKRIFTE